jgi:D-amino-acid oxidase
MYIVPRLISGTCVIGGTDTDDWTQTATDAEAAEIFERCAAADPSLEAGNRKGRVGLRPTRRKVRLELEVIGGRDVIHNYGHGGGGFTVSWGCAQEVLRLVRELDGPRY